MTIRQWFERMPVSVKIPAVVMSDWLDFKGFVRLSIISQFSRTCAAPG
jgi:hypothetical protein